MFGIRFWSEYITIEMLAISPLDWLGWVGQWGNSPVGSRPLLSAWRLCLLTLPFMFFSFRPTEGSEVACSCFSCYLHSDQMWTIALDSLRRRALQGPLKLSWSELLSDLIVLFSLIHLKTHYASYHKSGTLGVCLCSNFTPISPRVKPLLTYVS